MYTFLDNIRVRTCDELSFLINISNNNFFVIKTNVLEYLQAKLEEGLSTDQLTENDPNFVEFVKELERQNILGVND